MKSQEAAIKITSELGMMYPEINQAIVRQAIESILYAYTVTGKETSLAVFDNIGDMALLYLATKKTEGLSDGTIKSYGRVIGQFSRYVRKNVEDISAMDVRIYISNRVKSGLKNTTLANETNIMRGFFSFLEDEDYIVKSPMKKIKTIKVEKRLRKALSKEEFEVLRTGAKTLRQKALLELLYSTGCRLEEVEQMKKTDIDWQRLQIKVVGKGNKQRMVYINATAQVHLRKYFMSRLDECDAVFVTQNKPIKFLGKRSIEREIDEIMKQSGLQRNVYPHLIRHTFAEHKLNSGMRLEALQEIL